MVIHRRHCSRKSPGQAPSSTSRFLEHRVGQPFQVRLPPVLSFLLPVLLCGYPRISSTSSLAFHDTSFSSRTLMFFSWKFSVTSYHLPRRRRRCHLIRW